MEKVTIYDYARMCKAFKNNCGICPMSIDNNGTNELCAKLVMKHPDKANEIILKWIKEHPEKTRQSKFLEMFPNAVLNLGVISVCPCVVDTKLYKGADNVDCYRSKGYENCLQCYKDYWLAEVDE